MKVLLASDGSENAEQATRFLRRFPHLENLEVTVMNCFEIPPYAFNETSSDWMIEFRDIATEGAKVVQAETKKIFKNTDANLSFVTKEGHAGYEIVDFAKSNGFELIVLGATGHSMLSRFLLGSVSDYVATHADCSVLVVRPTTKNAEEEQLMNVTIAYDGSKQSKVAIDEFSRIIWGAKIEIHLVHSSQSHFAYRDRLQPIPESHARLRQAAILDELKLVAKQLPFADPDPQVHLFEAGHIGQSIIEFASRSNSDIVMMGDTGQSAIDRMLLGSTSRFVLRHAPMSVWIARRRASTA